MTSASTFSDSVEAERPFSPSTNNLETNVPLQHEIQTLAERPFPTTEEHLTHPARQALDAAVFDLLGLNDEERTAVLTSLRQRIQARKK